MKKRFLAMALCLAMTLSLFPTGAFANPENEPAAPRSEAVAEIVQEQQTEALPEAAGKTEESTTEAPAVPVMAEAEIAAEAEKADAEPAAEPEKADAEPAAEPEKADAEPEKADSEALAEPEKAESEASGGPAKADSEPVEPEAETAKEPAEENSGSKWDALKNSIANLFGGAVEPANIVPDLKVDTYEFYVDGKIQENWTQRVAKGDELKIPGTPKKEGYVFEGWFHGDTEVKSGKITNVSNETVHVKAKFQEANYVRFMGRDGTTVMHTAQGTKGEPVSDGDISTAVEMVRLTLGSEESVQGWSDAKDGTIPLGNITFAKGTRTLYPVVEKGYWVTFESAGGSYIAPQFSNAGKTMQLKPFEPKRAGYKFAGWYQGEQKVDSVSGKATVTAKWEAGTAPYTVIYWQENADDDKYSFKEAETKNGTPDTEAKADPTKKYPGFELNEKKTETKTIAGDGSTILNVYYKRNVYKVRFYKREYKAFVGYVAGDEYTELCITAKYGANISKKWPKKNGSSTWYVDVERGSARQVNIDTMPLKGANFYGPETGSGSQTASYYVEVLPGEKPELIKNNIGYKLHHQDTSPQSGWGYSTVTKEDQYPITGFTLAEEISTGIGDYYDGAEFYYSRNSYDIVFYSGKAIVNRESHKFQQSIADVSYTPDRPDNIPDNYQFAGWYEDEQCVASKYDFAGRTMPANPITLYAKWAAPQITVTIRMKDGSEQPITVPYGSELKESPAWNALVETLRPEPDAWMDANNGNKIFNLDTKLHKNYTLTPYYISDATQCVITYVEGEISWDDHDLYAKGSKATIRNPQHSEGLNFQCWEMDNQRLLPGQSINVTGNVELKAVYGEPLENTLKLTYHNSDYTKVYENLPANSEQIAADPAQLGTGFETPEGKKFAGWVTAENGEKKYQVNEKFYITSDGKNDLYAVWEDLPDIGKTSVATIDAPQSVPYDGSEHKWVPIVLDKDGKALTDADYEVIYSTDNFTDVTGTITVTITGIGNYTGKVEKTYQITPRTVTLKSANLSKVYDGTALTNGETALETQTGWVDGEGATYTFTGSQTVVGNSANAFSYKLNEGTKESNYTIDKTEGTLTITGKSIIPTDENGMTVTPPVNVKYSGSEQKEKPTVMDHAKQLAEGTDYTLDYTGDTINAGTVTVTITGIGNYTGSTRVEYQILKRSVTLTSETASKAYDGTPLTRPDVTVGGDKFVAGEVSDIKANGSVTTVAEGQVTNTITYTEGANFKASNYDITKHEGKLSIGDQSIDPDNPNYNGVTVDSPDNKTYDGTEHKWAPKVKDKEGNALTEGEDYTVSYSTEDFTNVGTITVTIIGAGNYTDSVERTYEITKRSVTLTSETASKAYDGTPLTRPEVTVTGDDFVDGEVTDIKATGSVTTVTEGEVTNTITYTEGANFKASNYDITKNEGKLSITARPISSNGITVKKLDDVLYDGGKHEQKPVVKDGETPLTEGEHYTLHYDGDTTNAGTVKVVVSGKGNYNGETSVSYKITPRSVILTSETDSKVYDGTPLTRPNVKVEGDGFVAGEVEENSIRATGSVLNVGDNGKNAIEFTTTDAFKYTNYAITKNEGTLTITGQSIVPDPNNPGSYKGITISKPTDALYDGNPHKWAPEVKDKDGNALTENTDYTVAYKITQKAKPNYRDYTDVCTIEVTITGKGNYTGSVTKTYRITPRKVTLTSETASKPYDGTPLTKPDVTVSGDGFVAGEAYKILAHGTVIEVKDSPVENKISYQVTENYKGDNYIVTYECGTLSITGQSIVPDPDNPESYKGITISDPKDSTYDGKEHKWAPEVKDKEGKALTENTDYTVSYDKTDFTNVTGKITVTITGKGNYTGKVEKSYQILPATLTVTTNSAEKTHDGNRLTADGTITGFVNGETATFMITGSQTDVGSSTNTYKIEWNGTAKQSNYTIVEKLGTLKVNERSGGGGSGGGSSSTPTPAPEQTPTPTPAPVIVPPAPAPTPAPARRITPAATATPTPAPTAKPTETKQPEPEPEVIEPDDPPLAPLPTGAWALVNLILMLLTVLASLLLLLGYLGKKKHTARDEYGNERIDYTRNKKGFWRVASLIPAIAAVIAFVLTENMKLPMIMVDRWTLLMAVIAVLQLIVAVMSKKQKESQDEEDEANA